MVNLRLVDSTRCSYGVAADKMGCHHLVGDSCDCVCHSGWWQRKMVQLNNGGKK